MTVDPPLLVLAERLQTAIRTGVPHPGGSGHRVTARLTLTLGAKAVQSAA